MNSGCSALRERSGACVILFFPLGRREASRMQTISLGPALIYLPSPFLLWAINQDVRSYTAQFTCYPFPSSAINADLAIISALRVLNSCPSDDNSSQAKALMLITWVQWRIVFFFLTDPKEHTKYFACGKKKKHIYVRWEPISGAQVCHFIVWVVMEDCKWS